MIKLLLGGSPCTYWSIAQKNNRETKAEGLGWELFKNYIIAKEKFKPDYFLYENNKSAAQAIKDQIKKELKVWDGSLFMQDSGARYIEINSALVSAQNRQRFYVHNFGDVKQPEDRKIFLKDIIERGISWQDKSFALTTRCVGAIPEDTIKKHRHQMIAEPVRVGALPRPNGELSTSQAFRVYNIDRKSVTINAGGGGAGGKTGLYAIPVTPCGTRQVDKARCLRAGYAVASQRDLCEDIKTDGQLGTTGVIEEIDYATPIEWNDASEPVKAICDTNGKKHTVYKVLDGKITINGAEYPIKLPDGFYIIRKLTVKECCRLQTMPDDYCRAVSDSQAYKGLGNGWTAEVIIHILNGVLKDVPRDEEIVVLSMYDGIGTGRYCLDKMGFTNVKYYAYEIDAYAKQIANSNYPDIVQCGDAFQLRNDDWRLY